MTVPSNHARALEYVLQALSAQGTAQPTAAWAKVLGAEYESVEFARRHAEVCALYHGTLQLVASLPPRSRERYESYAWSWWRAIIVPVNGWAARVDLRELAAGAAHDQLAGAADLIESRLTPTPAVASDTNLDGLRSVVQEWIGAVEGEHEHQLPEALRLLLLQDLRHVIWLIDNAELFGTGRVASAAEAATGNITVASSKLSGADAGVWIERGKKLVRAILLLGGLEAGVETAFMLPESIAGGVDELPAGPSDRE